MSYTSNQLFSVDKTHIVSLTSDEYDLVDEKISINSNRVELRLEAKPQTVYIKLEEKKWRFK